MSRLLHCRDKLLGQPYQAPRFIFRGAVIQLDHIVALRLQRGAEQLHRLGPRETAEFLAQIAGRIGGMPAIMGLLAEYERRLTPAMLQAAGGEVPAPRAGGGATMTVPLSGTTATRLANLPSMKQREAVDVA
jgi:hypothetical protein